MSNEPNTPTILPWHKAAAAACFEKTSSPFLKDIAESIARHDPAHGARTERNTVKAQETLDAELIALAALANIEAVLMAGDNAVRATNNESPAWGTGHGLMPAGAELQNELYKRGYKL